MARPEDPYWDELGVAWRAIDPDPKSIEARLEVRMRWQASGILGVVILGFALAIAGIALGVYTLWVACAKGIWNFFPRGAGLIAISVLIALISSSLRAGLRRDTSSLREVIELAEIRAQRTVRAVRLGYWVCSLAGGFGLLGFLVRVHFFRPPAMSPVIQLVFLGVSSIALFLYERRLRDDLARLRHLKRALTQEQLLSA